MATVALSTSSVTLDSGTAYELTVLNSGTVSCHVQIAGGVGYDERLRPGQQMVVHPNGSAVTAFVRSGTGEVQTTISTNPETASGGGGSFLTTSAAAGTYLQHVGDASGDATGVTDFTAINALLAAARAAGGGTVRGKPGQSYKLSASLTIGSNTTLDMTGCTVTEVNGKNTHMVQNYGYANPAGTGTGSIASGGNVITTTAGATATVGMRCVIEGAGGDGNGPLIGIVSARASGTITLLDLDGRPANATATVVGAVVTLYNPDSHVTVKGGTWDLGNNQPSPFPAILMYHVDDVVIDLDRYVAGATSRGVGISDSRNYWVRVRDCVTASVGVQLAGPLSGGRIEYVEGQSTFDDLVAVVAGDYVQPGTVGIGGDIIGLTVGTIKANDTYLNIFKVIAGAGRKVDGLKVDGAILGTGRSTIVWLGDDPASAGTTGGTYGDIDLGMIKAVSTNGGPLYLVSPSADRIKAHIRHDPLSTVGGTAVGIGGTSTATIKLLDLSGSATGASNGFVNFTVSNVTVNSLVLNGVVMTPGTSSFKGVAAASGMTPTLNGCTWRDCQFQATGQTQYPVYWIGGTLSRVRFLGGAYSGGANLVSTQGATGATKIVLGDGCYVTGFGRLASCYTDTEVHLDRPIVDSITNLMLFVSGASLTVLGHIAGTPGIGLVQRAGSEVVRVNSPTISVDQTLLTPSDGDYINNSNAAAANGVGVAVYNATTAKWMNPQRATDDPLGHGIIWTFDPLLAGTNGTIAANRGVWQRVVGGGTITAIGVHLAVSSGNVGVALYRNTGSKRTSAPGTLVASSGSVASPGTGFQAISLGGSFTVQPGDWFYVGADNATVSFRVAASPIEAGNLYAGRAAFADTAFPAPASNPAVTVGLIRSICLIGVP